MLRGAAVLTVLVAAASCGSRTGLFVPDLEPIVDAAADAVTVADAAKGTSEDARPDVRLDAAFDARLDGPLACVPGTFRFDLATPQLMFVLDRSGSMDFALNANARPPPGQPTRWMALRDALAQTIIPLSNQIAMGARFYPAAGADGTDPVLACVQDPFGTAIAPALANATALLDVFDKTSPRGGTPTAVGLQLAAQQLSASRTIARAMVVATDGAPNCNAALDGDSCACTSSVAGGCAGATGGTNCLDDTQTIATITNIFDGEKIPVYVVGIGVTSAFGATLDAMAVAGGRPRAGSPKYYPADTPAELTDAFTVVRDSVAKCSYITPSSPDDPDGISVVVAGQRVARDPSRVEGWDWIDQAYGHLQLFGAACNRAHAEDVTGTISCDKD